MTDYDFRQLNDKEFEVLAIELLSASLDKRIERFKPGKDKGVDGRFFSDSGGEIIIQCKHYIKTGYEGLISKLKTRLCRFTLALGCAAMVTNLVGHPSGFDYKLRPA